MSRFLSLFIQSSISMKVLTRTLALLFCISSLQLISQCGPLTPSFTVSLIGSPNGVWTSPVVQRADNCCGTTPPDVCVKFTIFLDPNAMGINFGIASGAVPGGAMFYQINCGPPVAVGSPICLSGAGPHILTFCKPGNNNNTYSISSIPSPIVPDSISVRSGCSQTLAVSGFSVPTITWNSIAPGAPGTYNPFLSCTAGCASVVVTPSGSPPAFVDYVVGGFGQSPCQANYYKDTIRVKFYSDLLAGINPPNSTICFGSTNAVLTATASGGKTPYTYTWMPGGMTGSVVTVGPGTYTVLVGDNTNCPPTTATAVVTQYTLPISANAGNNFTICKSSPTVALNGTVTNATGGTWSGGTGTFSPTSNSVTTSYIPTAGELTAGSVQLYLTTTGNSGCPPKKDTLVVSFQNIPIADAGPSTTVCANNSVVNLSGSITGFASTGTWSATGNGVFGSITNPITTFTPGSTNIAAGGATLTITSTGNGVCPPATSTVAIVITPSPVVNAGTGGSICSNSSFNLNGTVSGATTTGSWTTSGNGTFSPSNSALNGTYTPGSADIAAGTVTLTLTSTNFGNCLPVQDTIIINVKQLATVNAGLNQALCSNAGSISLNGTITGGTSTGSWTATGAGGYTPGNTALTTSYAMTPADITAGFVTFTLSSTNNGPCPIIKDTVKVSITKLAVVNAGPNQQFCSNVSSIPVTGTVTSAPGTGIWSATGPGGFSPSNTSMNASYAITPTDLANGFVTFTLSSTNNGPCPAVTDTVKIIIGSLATASVASGPLICSTAGTLALLGNVSGVTNTGQWTTSGTGSFSPSSTNLNPTYSITAADIAAGIVTFTLTTTNNGPCPAVFATTQVSISLLATVNAGANQLLCSNAGTIGLNGTVSGVTNTGFWSASGTGGYNPSSSNLSTSYSMTPLDITGGSVTFTLTSTNNGPCPAVSDTVKVKITTLASVNAGLNQSICSNAGTISLSGAITGGLSSAGLWTSTGPGGYLPSSTSLNTSYAITPFDISAGSVTFTLTSTANGPCPAVTDTVKIGITKLAVVSAGPNQSLCSNSGTIGLNGTVSGAAGTGIWLASGPGSYNPGNTNLSTTYSMAPVDITNGSVTFTLTSTGNGPCPAVTDTVKISITTLASVNAGLNQALCSNAGLIALNGTITGALSSAGLWSSTGPGGYVPSNTSLSTSYAITPTDISAGSVTFTLTSTNNGPCPAVSDTVKMLISPLATVSAGPNQSLCSSAGVIALTGSVNGAGGAGIWSSTGLGTYNPGNTSLTTSYSMTPVDITNGSVTFTLTSTGNGACPAVSDTVKISITTLASVNAGLNQALCSNAGLIALNGTISGALSSAGLWTSTGPGGYVPSNTSLSTSYAITPADISAGSVTFTLTSTNNGPCPAVSDTVKMLISPLATVSAGPNQSLCSSAGVIALTGSVNGAGGAGIWSSTGLGTYNPGNTSLTTSYSMTPVDITNGSVTFTLTSTGNGACPAVTDTVKISITTLATVNAGLNQALCSNAGLIALNGTITGALSSAGLWTSTGPGGYVPSNTSLSTSYAITPTDISAGSVTFTLASTANGPCPAVSDTVLMSISPLGTVSAGPNQFLCSNAGTISLTGSVSGAGGTGIWTSTGPGTYNPGNTSLNTIYSITPADITNGSATFTLSSTGNGACPAVTDTVKIVIGTLVNTSVSLGSTICSNATSVALTATVSGGTTSGIWSSSGGGPFTPSASNLNCTYSITPADLAAGQITFTLISTNNGPCPASQDTLNVFIVPIPVVSAGPNQNLCSAGGAVTLNGSITSAAGTGTWTSSGTGTYNPGNSSLSTNYGFTPADITNGSVTFTLTSTNNGVCPAVSDTVKMSITTIASVNAGLNQIICSSTGTVALSGTIGGGTSTGIWSGGIGGNYIPSSSNLNNIYFITVSDVSNGGVTFTLTSTNNGPCPAVTDTALVNIVQLATVYAGPDQIICSNSPTLSLAGIIGGGTSTGIWSTGGAGQFIPNNTAVNGSYSITPTDITNGSVTFTLASTNNAPCPVVKDFVNVSITKIAVVTAGADINICSTSNSTPITGTVSGGTSTGSWASTGTGSFSGGPSLLNNIYNVSGSDKGAGSVLLILSSTNNGVCPVVSDTTKLVITPYPIFNLNKDTIICDYSNPFTAHAALIGGSGAIQWTTSGSGTFNFLPNPQYVAYTFSSADMQSGFVVLTVTSLNNGGCGNVSASQSVTIRPSPDAAFIASTYTANIPNDPVKFTNQSTGATSYQWTFGDGGSTNITSPTHNYTSVGYYNVELVATNQYGCLDTARALMTVISDVQFPNVFTPNTGGSNGGSYNPNDYSNDVFFPFTAGVTEYSLMIFNRWGELIFQSKDINVGWDGYFNGKLCQQDAYVWKANIKFFDGRTYDKTGNVTLLR